MEVTLLAWVLARTARLAAEWGEAPPNARGWREKRALLILSVAAPLVRPEGALGRSSSPLP